VHGPGPPLVFVHGALGGDLDWQVLVALLNDRYTCHLPSWRGRGLSGDHSDLSLGRRIGDVLAYVDSIGEATGLVGWSAGAYLAFAATTQSEAVNAVAAAEPVMASAMDDQDRAALGGTLARMDDLAADGRLTEAMRAFAGFVLNSGEITRLENAGYFEAAGNYALNLLELHRQMANYQGPVVDDPAVLATISASVLVLHGSDTKPYFTRGARLVADHVLNARSQEIAGAGHAAPLTHSTALAEPVAEFFSPVQRSA
jgi:pimeloyl-ACP methyl ester carboxylesterase